MAGGRVRGVSNRGNGKNKSMIASKPTGWSASDDLPKANTRAGGRNTHNAQAALLFLRTLSPVAFTAIFVSQNFEHVFSATSSSGLCFVPSPHRHSWHSVIGTVLSCERSSVYSLFEGIPCAVWVLVISCGTCTAFVCCTDTLRMSSHSAEELRFSICVRAETLHLPLPFSHP